MKSVDKQLKRLDVWVNAMPDGEREVFLDRMELVFEFFDAIPGVKPGCVWLHRTLCSRKLLTFKPGDIVILEKPSEIVPRTFKGKDFPDWATYEVRTALVIANVPCPGGGEIFYIPFGTYGMKRTKYEHEHRVNKLSGDE